MIVNFLITTRKIRAAAGFVKYKLNDAGRKVIDDIVIIENKLSDSTRLTPNQNAAKTKSSYTVRASKSKNSEIIGSTNELEGGDILNFNGSIQWYKAHDGADGDIITGITKL